MPCCPFTFSTPSETLQLGQVIPVTIQLHPFQKGSPLEGQVANIQAIQFTLLETRRLRDRLNENKSPNEILEVLKVGLPKDGWPQNSKDGWEKTVNLALPNSPYLSVETNTKYFDIFHELVLTMTIKARSGVFKKAEDYKAERKCWLVH